MIFIFQNQQFPKGQVYKIKNRKTGQYISAIMGSVILKDNDQYSEDQLWLVVQVFNEQYQIVHMKSGQVISWNEKNKSISLNHSNNKDKNQQWLVRWAQKIDKQNYFWIKSVNNQQNALHSSSTSSLLKFSSIDKTLRITLWQFIACHSHPVLDRLSLIKLQSSGLVLNVPENSLKLTTRLTHYLFNGLGNQRWLFQQFIDNNSKQATNIYYVKNYCSDLFLTAYFKKNQFSARQNLFNNELEQRWKFLHISDNKFLIQSMFNTDYYLSVSNDEKGGSQIILSQQFEKSNWIIEGHIPFK